MMAFVGNLIIKVTTFVIFSLDQLLCAGHGGENGRVVRFRCQKLRPRTCQVSTFIQPKKVNLMQKYTVCGTQFS